MADASEVYQPRTLLGTHSEGERPTIEVSTKSPKRALIDLREAVCWGPMAPKVVRPGWPFRVDIWAYAAKDKAFVGALPCEELGDRESLAARPISPLGAEACSTGESCAVLWTVTVEPGEDLIFHEKAETLVFKGDPVLLSFQCDCAVGARPGFRTCRISATSGFTNTKKHPPPRGFPGYTNSTSKQNKNTKNEPIVHETLFEIEVEQQAATLTRAAAKLEKALGYELRLSEIWGFDQMIRESILCYRAAVQSVCKRSREELVAFRRLIGVGSRRLYRTAPGGELFCSPGASKKKGQVLLAPQHAEGMGMKEIAPLRVLRAGPLLREALHAQKVLKNTFAPGTSWAATEMTPEWAAGIDAEHGLGAHRKFRVIRGSQNGWRDGLVAEVDGAYDPGVKTMSRLEQKLKAIAKDCIPNMETYDVARIALQADTVSTLLRGLQHIRKSFNVIAVENRFAAPSALGWIDLCVYVEVRLGGNQTHVAEIQLHLTKLSESCEVAEGYLDRIREKFAQIGVQASDLDRAEWLLLNELQSRPLSAARVAFHEPAPKAVSEWGLGVHPTLATDEAPQTKSSPSSPSKAEGGVVGRHPTMKRLGGGFSQNWNNRPLQRSEHVMSAPALINLADTVDPRKMMKILRFQPEETHSRSEIAQSSLRSPWSMTTTSLVSPTEQIYGRVQCELSHGRIPSCRPPPHGAPLRGSPKVPTHSKNMTSSTLATYATEREGKASSRARMQKASGASDNIQIAATAKSILRPRATP